MKTEIKPRTFGAAKYPKGSEERVTLNIDPLTSEYYTSRKYCLTIYFAETDKYNSHEQQKTFTTKTEAEDYSKRFENITEQEYYERMDNYLNHNT